MQKKLFLLFFLSFSFLKPNNDPQISIITILNNDSQLFIEGFLENIVNQTIFNKCELILVTNGNTINNNIINEYKNKFPNIKFYKLKNKLTLYTVLNTFISISKAKFITNLNVEDRFDKKFLEIYLNELESNNEIDLVYSGYYITYNKNETFEKNNYKWVVDPAEFSISNMQKYLPGPAPMWRKSLHKKNGSFDIKYQYCANWELWLRCIKNDSQFKKVNGTYTLYYSQELSSVQKEKQNSENAEIYRRYESLWDATTTTFENVLKNKLNEEKPFVIIIPSYNNKYWYQRNLNSVFTQNYNNYRAIYIDDSSSDKTAELVESYIKLFNMSDKVQLIKNKDRKGALENLYNAIHSCKPEEIIVTLDGDDWFANENVLNYLNHIYQDTDVWMTYGQFHYYPNDWHGWAKQIPQEIIKENQFRNYSWRSTHLRTFYAGLFHKIKKDDLMHENKFFSMAWDLAFMFPMLEMSGNRSKFISEILYIYNFATNSNDQKTNPELQSQLENIIRHRKKYVLLKNFLEGNKDQFSKKKIYIYADQWGSLFDLTSIHNRDDCLQPTYQLKKVLEKENIELIHTKTLENLKDADFIVLFNFDENCLKCLKNYSKEKLILFLWEPKTTAPQNYHTKNHELFEKIYTWNEPLVDNKKYFKFYYPHLNPLKNNILDRKNKKLCTMICMNKQSNQKNELYSLRKKIIEYFENIKSNDFTFYGMYWPEHSYKNYARSITKKYDILKNFLFCFCIENIQENGYITEKIFDCFQASCIPIYLGANNIQDYIPKNCYIDFRDFKNLDELYIHLKSLDEHACNQYIENIKKFVNSDQAQLFSINNFIKIFKEACNIN